MHKHHIYTLTVNLNGRIIPELLAEFINSDDATVFGKKKAFELHVNVLHVACDGSARVYSEAA